MDEIVLEEADLDGDGSFETQYAPLYDSSGNLVALTGTDGSVFERYEYTSFGGQVTRVDAQVPQIDQVLFRENAVRIEFSETMDSEELGKAILDGRIRLKETSTGTPVESEWVPYIGPVVDPELSPASAPSSAELATLRAASTALRETAGAAAATSLLSTTLSYESPQQIRRFLLRPITAPALGTEVRLVLEASALVDIYGNAAGSGVDLTFSWPSSETVLSDATAPEIHAVRLRQGHLEIELTEEPDQATVQTAIDVGQPVTWTLLADNLTLQTAAPLSSGPFTLTIGIGLQDLAGLGLAATFSLNAELAGTGDSEELFEQTDDRRVDPSSVGNVFGFHGLPKDPETGLIYVRNRYYDPEIGRFITADPLGYVDGPSMYQFAGYSPANFGDPLGLQHDTQYPLWQAAHPSALPEPEDADWSMRDMARWVLSGYNRPGSQGRAYLSRFKEKWVEEYREVIIQSAITNDLPPELVGGVAFQEVGGDPRWADDLGYFVRSVFPLHVVLPEAQKDPMLTSFGDISMQIRRAAETFDLGPDKMTTAEKNVLIAALKNPEANIRLVSAHLADIRNKLFPAKKAKDLTRDDIRLLATAFNRGPSLSRKELERVPSYGIAVLKHLPEVRRALGTSQPLQSDNTTEKPIP